MEVQLFQSNKIMSKMRKPKLQM